MLEKKYMSQPTLNCNPFTMALNGVVDAPVNGGVNMYRTTFFTKEYLDKNPSHKEWVEQLKQELMRQVRVVNRCIEVHAEIVPPDVRPLHDKLVESTITHGTRRSFLSTPLTPTLLCGPRNAMRRTVDFNNNFAQELAIIRPPPPKAEPAPTAAGAPAASPSKPAGGAPAALEAFPEGPKGPSPAPGAGVQVAPPSLPPPSPSNLSSVQQRRMTFTGVKPPPVTAVRRGHSWRPDTFWQRRSALIHPHTRLRISSF